jgi:hypothetical protein
MPEFTVPAGMPRSVWENKYARKTADGTGRQGNERNEGGFQSWSERLTEVVNGNFLLDPRPRSVFEPELGRHLQHGD